MWAVSTVAEISDADLEGLIAKLGLKAPRELAPCGTAAAYRRQRKQAARSAVAA